jgi:hypothetical protein
MTAFAGFPRWLRPSINLETQWPWLMPRPASLP